MGINLTSLTKSLGISPRTPCFCIIGSVILWLSKDYRIVCYFDRKPAQHTFISNEKEINIALLWLCKNKVILGTNWSYSMSDFIMSDTAEKDYANY